MKNIFVVLAVMAAVVLTSCGGGKKQATVHGIATPVVVITDSLLDSDHNDTIDFGRIYEGETATSQVSFVNGTNAPIAILRIETSCDCTDADFADWPFQPGDTIVSQVYFRSAGHDGYVAKPITYRTSLGHGRYRVMAIANVVAKPTAENQPQ